MLLLSIASCALFFVTYFTGLLAEKILRRLVGFKFSTNFFDTFLFGLIASFIYFNIVSFFFPVNDIVLLPLLFTGSIVFFHKQERQLFSARIMQTVKLFVLKRNLLFVLPFIIMLFIYWIVPPLNRDSGEYHYIAIRWYEQYRIIPGLANVHGRLGFNPASFIISAPWSFSNITGQALYPLNGVLVLLFYAWLLKKIFLSANNLYAFILLVLAILLCRITLINISSPSSDLLSGLLLFYCGFRSMELMRAKQENLEAYFPVFLFTVFAVTAKLSAVPSLLLIPFIFFLPAKKTSNAAVVLRSLLPAALIVVPWLARNVLLSGYLLYPVPALNVFHPDWAVPHDVIQLDYLFSKYGPRTITVDFFTLQNMNLVQLTQTWYQYLLENSISSLLITVFSFLSPFLWLLFPLLNKKIPRNQFLLWCIYYICICIWLINSPEHRFGLPYLALAGGLPLLELCYEFVPPLKIPFSFYCVIVCFCSWHYSKAALYKDAMYPFSLKDCWLHPLRDRRYFSNNNLLTFPQVDLGSGIKLYFPDNTHECLNADGPCMNWRYGQIELRGNTIEDGFRNVHAEVEKDFPFIHGGRSIK